MKKFSSILLIGIFVLLQANRWTAYISCQLKNIYTASSCDCERILATPGDAPADQHGGASYVHWHPDDFFCASKQPVIQLPETNLQYDEQPAGKGLAGFPLSRFKPPVA